MDCLHLQGQSKASCKQNKPDMENLIQIQGSKGSQKEPTDFPGLYVDQVYMHNSFCLLSLLAWKMEAAIHSSKTSVDFYQTTRQCKPDQTLYGYV
jgi:hypothetical protein